MPSRIASALNFSSITERDLLVFRGLLDSRLMAAAHIAALYFGGRAEMAKKRIQILKARGLVRARLRDSAFEPELLFLTAAGFALLKSRRLLRHLPPMSARAHGRRVEMSPLKVPHEMAVLDTKVALTLAAEGKPGVAIREFTTWTRLIQFECGGRRVMPDGFVSFAVSGISGEEPAIHDFFVEVDCSTEGIATLAKKAARYRAHSRASGHPRPFAVLFVLESERRRDGLAAALLGLNPPILTQAMLTTRADFTLDPLGPVWLRPIDYRSRRDSNQSSSTPALAAPLIAPERNTR